jgi:uncharacterized cupin superfamily protein
MIIRKSTAPAEDKTTSFGQMRTEFISNAGGLTQFGAYVTTLQPGTRASMRHWHEKEDEFMLVLSGEVTITEDDGDHVLTAGDAACWPAGVPNAHTASNRSAAPCSYLIMGTRPTHDICHYPDDGRTLHTEGDTWRLVDTEGRLIRSGVMES